MIYSRIEPQRAEISTAIRGLCETIQAVGSDSFPTRFSDLLFGCFQVREFLVFQRPGPAAPPEALHSQSAQPRAADRAGAYCRGFFRDDPIYRVLNENPTDGTFAIRVRPEEIRNPMYREICYTRPGLVEKLTLAQRTQGRTIAVSIFATEADGAFDPRVFEDLCQFGNLLLPVLELHYRLMGNAARSARISASEMEECVRETFPELTDRETAVCARSILGVTAEGIALDLGIKQTSVLTYRRRAYARLNVNSINQLSTMLIQSAAARQLATSA